jgi:hypothetical protein
MRKVVSLASAFLLGIAQAFASLEAGDLYHGADLHTVCAQ